MNPKDLWVVYNRVTNLALDEVIHSLYNSEEDAYNECVRLNEIIKNKTGYKDYGVNTLPEVIRRIVYNNTKIEDDERL